jgi:predicted O-methyltransferase YrrM
MKLPGTPPRLAAPGIQPPDLPGTGYIRLRNYLARLNRQTKGLPMAEPQAWRDVDAYFTGLLAPPDAALTDALRDSDAAGLPRINVAANQGKLLHLLAVIQGATRILEIGTLGGYSTIWLARALPRDGRLIILDNAVRDGAVTDADSDSDGPSVRGTREALELFAAHPKVTATAIQTVGVKGYDGFALARVLP